MAEEEEVEVEETKKPKSPLIIIIVVALVATILAGGVSFFIVKKMLGDAADNAQTKVVVAEREGPLLPLEDEFLVNLADEGSNHYIKAKVAIEVANEETLLEVTERVPKIRDDIIAIMRTRTMEDIQQPDGMLKLKEEIRKKCNEGLTKGTILMVYFTDFVMQ